MYFPPKRPEDKDAPQTPAERRERGLLEITTTSLPDTLSWGERFLPIFYAAMETCWLDAVLIGLASINLFLTRDTLIPLWAPFVILVGSSWLARRLEHSEASKAPPTMEKVDTSAQLPGTSQFVTLLSVITVFLVWLRLYAQAYFLFDPRWLLALLNDILLLNLHAFQAFIIVMLTLYLCWRGIRLSRRDIEPSHIYSALCLGMGVILAVILVRAGQESAGIIFHDEITLLLLIPIFLFLSLAAHALARVTFVRRSHPLGLQGSIFTQERAVLLVIGSVGLVLLIVAFTVGSVTSPSFLADTQRALAPLGRFYDLLVAVLAQVLILLLTPIFLLISWIISRVHPSAPRISQPPRPIVRTRPSPVPPEAVVAITISIKFILPILFVLLAIIIVRLALRRRRVRIVIPRKDEELRESVWSWSLFWMQLKLFLRALFGRFFARGASKIGERAPEEEIRGEPAARSIREIYRALLKKAASRGYPRKKDETPYEFEDRLDEKVPVIQPQLAEITTAYAATRYGGVVPDEAEVLRIRGAWSELDQTWRES